MENCKWIIPMIYHQKNENYHFDLYFWSITVIRPVLACPVSVFLSPSKVAPAVQFLFQQPLFVFWQISTAFSSGRTPLFIKSLRLQYKKNETNEISLYALENDQKSRRTLPNPSMLQSPRFFHWDNVVFLFRGWCGRTSSVKKPSTANF